MSPTKQPPFNNEDIALSHLLIDAASVHTEDPGEPVSPEELAVFVDGEAETQLGHARRQQIIYQLAQNEELYASWIDLVELSQKAEINQKVTANKPSQIKSALQTLHTWLAGFFNPQVAFSAAFSAVLTVSVYSVIISDKTYPPSLSVSEGSQAPIKAQIDKVDPTTNLAKPKANLAKPKAALLDWFLCTSINEFAEINLCYSNTLGLQHWLTVSNGGTTNAIPAPVEAQRILQVHLTEPLLVILYQRDKVNVVSVFEISLNKQQVALRLLYEDIAVPNGYIEIQKVEKSGLTYNKVSDKNTFEQLEYFYEDEN